MDTSRGGLSITLTYDSFDADPRTRAHSLGNVAAAGLAARRAIVSCRLCHRIAVAATQTRAAAESRDHTSDERAEQWQTSTDDGNVGFNDGPAEGDGTVICSRLASVSTCARCNPCPLRIDKDLQVMSSPRPPVLNVEIRMIVTMTTLEKHVSSARYDDRFGSVLQATKRENQTKAEFLTSRNLKQVLDQRHRQD